jgi:AraC-like DNA-binding protein/quercetin dioxygenase-like cupin family protein
MTRAPRALYQRFLPDAKRSAAHVWKFSLEFGGRRPRHFHDEPELNLITRGCARFGIGDATVEARAGELLAFPAGQDHALLEASPDLYLFAIGVSPKLSAEVLGGERHHAVVPAHVRLPGNELKQVVAGATALVDRSGVQQQTAELWERVGWLRQRHGTPLGSSLHVLTRRALTLLADEPQLERAALAKAARGSPYALSRCFHENLGTTLVKYRARLRLLRVIRSFDEGVSDLKGAASEAGFGSYSQCHRVFHAELGCSPRAFFGSSLRERMQNAYEPEPTRSR